jgi:dihydroneopterin aldolase
MNLEISTPSHEPIDHVYLKDFQLSAVVGPDAWGRPGKEQPVLISLKWFHELSGNDDIQDTLSYSKISKDIVSSMNDRRANFESAQGLVDFIVYVATSKGWKGLALQIKIHLPKTILQANNGLTFTRTYMMQDKRSIGAFKYDLYPKATIDDIQVSCIIGVNPHEREIKQTVRIDVAIEENLEIASEDGIKTHWQGLARHCAEVSQSFFL